MLLYETSICAQLPEISASLRDEILAAERNTETHRALLDRLDAFHKVELAGDFSAQPLPGTVSVAAWNLERCLDPDESAELLRVHEPDIVLLSEMDNGMARTGQRHTTAEVANRLGMGYAYVVEFYEIGLGSALEIELSEDDFNACGWHGNALLSKSEPRKVAVIRLDDHGHWFCETEADPLQPRIGGRVAVAAVFDTKAGPLCAVSTHLESAGSISFRQAQMDRVISAVDALAPGAAVIIGGDLNTGNNLPDPDWRQETLFAEAERQGYSWSNNAEGMTTRPSRLTRFPSRQMKLDWFAHRGLAPQSTSIVPALDRQKIALSDHELIVASFGL